MDAALTPLQQAKFRVLEVEVEQKIRELCRSMPAGRPAPTGAPPGRDAAPDRP